MCNARRAHCILLNLPLHLAVDTCTLELTSEAEINKQLQLLFTKAVALKLRQT